jgi:uncharacterized protein (TIRG00374 family)
MKNTLLWILKLGLSAVLIWFLLGSVDVDAVMARIKGMDLVIAGIAFALLILQVGITTVRWQIAMRGIDGILSNRDAFRYNYMGIFFSQTLPSSVGGDAVRMYKGYRRGLTLSQAINGVMLDRVATVLALALLVAAMTPFIWDRTGDIAIVAPFFLIAVGGVCGLIVLMLLDRLPSALQRWRIVRGLGQLASDTRRLFLNPATGLPLLAVSVIGHVNVSAAVYFLAQALGMQTIGLADCVALFPPVLLLTTVPISVAGWGVREAAMVTAFGFVGVAGADSLSLSLIFGVAVILSSLPGGLIFLLSKDRHIEELPTEPV